MKGLKKKDLDRSIAKLKKSENHWILIDVMLAQDSGEPLGVIHKHKKTGRRRVTWFPYTRLYQK